MALRLLSSESSSSSVAKVTRLLSAGAGFSRLGVGDTWRELGTLFLLGSLPIALSLVSWLPIVAIERLGVSS